MAFDSLSEKLQNVFKNLRSKGRLTEDFRNTGEPGIMKQIEDISNQILEEL